MLNDGIGRREFMKHAGLAAGGVVVLGLPFLQEQAAAAVSPDARSLTVKQGLELDGVLAGWVYSAEGGYATGDVVVEPMGADNIARKHIARPKYEEITVTCGTGMSKGFYDWLKASLGRQALRKNGAILNVDLNNTEVGRLNFSNALVTEIGFPALDAASRDAARITLKLSPELTRLEKPGAKKLPAEVKVPKRWSPANFRLRIQGLENACQRVNKIEALVIKQRFAQAALGDMRDFAKAPAGLEIPNLVIMLPESYAQDFYMWQDDFVVRGNNGPDREKPGVLELLTPDLREVLFTITFNHLGIFKVSPEKIEAGSENIRRVKAEMYCEEIQFDYTAAAI
jgi:hypothetical protein